MIISLNKRVVSDSSAIASIYNTKRIRVSIDSSKTNTAICIMSRTYKVLDLIEFDGSKDKDILKLIHEQRIALKIIFSGAIIIDGAIEDIITKKEEEAGGKYSEGLKHHHSRYVITAVFISLIVFFQDNFDITLEPFSNQAWKAAVLPKELNKRDIYKGSVEYIRYKYPQYITGVKDDDGSDAICIGEYMKLRANANTEFTIEDIPDEKEFTINPCIYKIFSINKKVAKQSSVQFRYNELLSLDSNARAIANRIEIKQLGWTICPIDKLDIEDIYKFCTGVFEENAKQVLLVVKRTSNENKVNA